MFHSLKSLALGVVLLNGLWSINAAQAQTVPLAASGEGQVILQIDPTETNPVGMQVYRFDGESSLMGRFTVGGITLFKADGTVLPSVYTAATSDGATISATYSGSFAPIAGTADFEFDVSVKWGNGTGRLAGVTGESHTIAILDGLTGSFVAVSSGEWVLP